MFARFRVEPKWVGGEEGPKTRYPSPTFSERTAMNSGHEGVYIFGDLSSTYSSSTQKGLNLTETSE